MLLIAWPHHLLAQSSTDEQLANLYFQDRDFEKAAYYFEKLFDANPSNQYYQPLLTSYIETGEFKKAEKLVKKRIKTNPGNLAFQVDLGYVARKAGDDNEAKSQYQKAIKALPANQQSVLDLANAFLGKNESTYAEETYLHGRKMFDGIYTFNMELAEIYSQAGEYMKMFDEYLGLIDQNPSYLQTVQNALQSKLANDMNGQRRALLKTILLKRIQKYPDAVVYSELLIWYYMQEQEFASALIQAKALDKRLHETGERIMNLGYIAEENGASDVAVDCYQYVIDKGKNSYYYADARIRLLGTLYAQVTGSYAPDQAKITDLKSRYIKTLSELGIGNQTALLACKLAHIEAFYLHETEPAIQRLQDLLTAPGISKQNQAQVKLELADIYVYTGERWESTLLYSQVEKDFKNDPIGHDAKLRNARLSYYMGDFNWARAQVDVLKAATSKLIANDALDLSLLITDNQDGDSLDIPLHIFARAELLTYRNLDSLALLTMDSITTKYPSHALADEILYRKAQIMEKEGKFEQATEFYQQIVVQFGTDILADNALFRLAELYEEYFKNPDKAMELYQQLMVQYQGSMFTVEARKRFRALRGDKLN